MYHLITGLYAEWTRKERFNILIVGLSGVGKSCILEKIRSIYLHRPALPTSRIAPTVGQNVFNLTLPSSHLHFWDLGGSPSVRSLWSKYYEESHALVWVVDARDWIGVGEAAHGSELGVKAKGKAKAVEPPEQGARRQAREESWRALATVLEDPALEGLPILILANKVDACSATSESTASPDEVAATTRTIKRWFAQQMAQDTAAENSKAEEEGQEADLLGARAGSEEKGLVDSGYQWEVVATSALDGTGIHDAVDWLYIRVQNVKR